VIPADPDLGWERVDDDLDVDEAPHVDRTDDDKDKMKYGGGGVGIIGKSRTLEADSRRYNLLKDLMHKQCDSLQIELSNVPEIWKMCFYNPRTSRFSHPVMPLLALNLAYRASKLAVQFGVISDKDGSMFELESSMDVKDAPVADEYDGVYSAIGIPNYKWQLLQRDWSLPKATQPKKDAKTLPLLQKMRNRQGHVVLADCGKIGMNIAEQLYRLERPEDRKSKTPNDGFGWSVTSMHQGRVECVVVASVEMEAFLMVPEEVLMSVASWVQDTYLTQSLF